MVYISPALAHHYYGVPIPYPRIVCYVCGVAVTLPEVHVKWHQTNDKEPHP